MLRSVLGDLQLMGSSLGLAGARSCRWAGKDESDNR